MIMLVVELPVSLNLLIYPFLSAREQRLHLRNISCLPGNQLNINLYDMMVQKMYFFGGGTYGGLTMRGFFSK